MCKRRRFLNWQTWVLLFSLVNLTSRRTLASPIHGVYLDEDWLLTEKAETILSALHAHLAASGVRDLYVQVRDLKSPNLGEQTARLQAETKGRNSALRLFSFLGRRVCTSSAAACFDLRNGNDTRRLQSQVQQLWQLGYDGVQLDLEPVASGDIAFLALLENIKRDQPAGKLLSVAGSMFEPTAEILARVQPRPSGGAKPLYWSRDYYREVLRRTDSIVMMNYDTGIQSPIEYRHWTVYQLKELLAIQRTVGRKLIQLGIPAYKHGRRGLYNAQAESALVALDAASEVLGSHCPAPMGITPYHESEMNQAHWMALSSYTESAERRCRLPSP